jgi:hypothetical protein
MMVYASGSPGGVTEPLLFDGGGRSLNTMAAKL